LSATLKTDNFEREKDEQKPKDIMKKTLVKIATAAYPLDWMQDFVSYATKITNWVEEAKDCDLLIFPEYGSMELASLGGREVAGDLEASLHEVARHQQKAVALHCDLAQRFGLHILMASSPYFIEKRPFNRAILVGPQGVIGYQDKQIMTRFEREEWDVIANSGLKLFETPLGRIGILICYDSEFPLLGRVLAEAEVDIILVPSCTDTIDGFHRVKIGSQARALESQCVVVHSATVGLVPWCPAVDENHGAAGIYAPSDGFWPQNGIVASGTLDNPGWIKAEIDRTLISQSRKEGRILTWRDWPESTEPKLL